MEIRDKDLKALIRDLPARDTGPCPDEEELASYLEGKLASSGDADRIARHILSCDLCRDALSAASAEVPDKFKVPVHAVRKSVELVPIRDGPWEIVVNFVTDAIEVVRNTGDKTQYFAPAYATVRGPGLAPGSLVAFSRRFAGLDAEVEIERVAPKTMEIKVTARNCEDGKSPKGLRANLHRDGKELMSYVLQGGSTIFDKVKFGNYTIDFTRRGIRIGEISLKIKGE